MAVYGANKINFICFCEGLAVTLHQQNVRVLLCRFMTQRICPLKHQHIMKKTYNNEIKADILIDYIMHGDYDAEHRSLCSNAVEREYGCSKCTEP